MTRAPEKAKDVKPQSYNITSRNTKAIRVVHDHYNTAVTIPPGETREGIMLRPDIAEYLGKGDLTLTATQSPTPISSTPEEPPGEVARPELPDVRLPEEPQFEGPGKWRPEDVKIWFKEIRRNYPQGSDESKTAYAVRLYGHMEKDFENPLPWDDAESLRRRLNDPNYD
jgi:hypothetical protein